MAGTAKANTRKLKVAVLISGRGSNLQAIIEACARDDFPAQIVGVIANVASAKGLVRARHAGLQAQTVAHRDFASRDAFEDALHDALKAIDAELVCLAGFMRILSPGFVTRWRDRLVNIHPSLLPAFKGLHTHERALEAGVRFTGCTVHFVRAETDDGPIIIQAVVPVAAGDTVKSLAARVLAEEHRIYPEAIRLIAMGQVKVMGRRVAISGAGVLPPALCNPPCGAS
ncbi:MAG: phosphoribosylglycinamide formyltransferase [Pseudomonadota bacterium]